MTTAFHYEDNDGNVVYLAEEENQQAVLKKLSNLKKYPLNLNGLKDAYV